MRDNQPSFFDCANNIVIRLVPVVYSSASQQVLVIVTFQLQRSTSLFIYLSSFIRLHQCRPSTPTPICSSQKYLNLLPFQWSSLLPYLSMTTLYLFEQCIHAHCTYTPFIVLYSFDSCTASHTSITKEHDSTRYKIVVRAT